MVKVAYENNNSNKNIFKSLFSKKKLIRFFVVSLVVLILFVLAMVYFVTPIIVKTGKAKINETTNRSMNSAISETMGGTVTYDDLIHIVTDGNGKISLLQANVVVINTLTQKIIERTYSTLFNKLKEPLQIPLGSFFGVPAFSMLGPVISVDVMPYGNVNCYFRSKFQNAGINQTLHKIYAYIKTDVTFVMPMAKLSSENEVESLICESLIIGEIPHTYLVADNTSDLLNVID